ncbi:MAG TPA: GPR endopeptidase [Candidatus Pelethenecus faecipullorum]|uniref:GPR endopeptidase n=1 Tax=Candidatus Pelethenecus faecipullorum TaxID=2840900 RepID=A0A9D1KIZ6_9MOLU|nr:GPR endopeptidase [Candidatus Pelethenecus faecipullorum]
MAARTDMAVESGNVSFQYDWDKKVQGMIYRKLFVDDDLAKRLKKGKGIYYNIDQVDYLYKQKPATKLLMTAIQDCLSDLKLEENSDILICGLGNDSVTPDALGPLVINKIEVNRHRSDTAFRFTTSAMCPGVMGQTGMESSEIIKAVVDDFKPRLVIVVDALACNDPARMCHSIQLSTAGINPGSGVGNKRKEISKKTLGVDVLAIGVPTVSDIDAFVDVENNFFVTPKDIDLAMDILSQIIAQALNRALN